MKRLNIKIAAATLVIIVLFPIISALLSFSGGFKLPAIIGILSVLFLSKNKNFRKSFFSSSVLIWLLLMSYHFINAYTLNVPETDINVLISCVIIPVIALGLTIYLFQDFDLGISIILYTYYVFTIMAFLVFKITGTVNDEGRIALESLHPNVIGQYAGFTAITLSIYSIYKNKSIIFYSLGSLLPLSVILLTQSRNSFSIFFMSIIIYVVGYLTKEKAKLKVLLITTSIILVGLFAGQYISQNTNAGQRFTSISDGEMMQANVLYSTGTVFDQLLGERIVYYVVGYKNFLDNPINGIGLWNYNNYNKSTFPLHSEYMVHLAEGGLIGISLYAFFIYSVISLFVNYKNKKHYLYKQIQLILVVILFLAITAREFRYVQFFLMWGLVIGFLRSNQAKVRK